jgi:hypothetical protein
MRKTLKLAQYIRSTCTLHTTRYVTGEGTIYISAAVHLLVSASNSGRQGYNSLHLFPHPSLNDKMRPPPEADGLTTADILYTVILVHIEYHFYSCILMRTFQSTISIHTNRCVHCRVPFLFIHIDVYIAEYHFYSCISMRTLQSIISIHVNRCVHCRVPFLFMHIDVYIAEYNFYSCCISMHTLQSTISIHPYRCVHCRCINLKRLIKKATNNSCATVKIQNLILTIL